MLSLILLCLFDLFKLNFGKEMEVFCSFGICDENTEYCCGMNQCCANNTSLYVLGTVIMASLIFIMACILYYVCVYKRVTYKEFNDEDMEA